MPDLSVVMSVYNGACTLARTLDGVLSQSDVDLEFIVVNDGSTDGTREILEQYRSADNRLRVIHQENLGLTIGLINGCRAARGEFIGRQDAGDLSLPGRFKQQVEVLRNNPQAVLVSGGTRFVGPKGEYLFDVASDRSFRIEGERDLDLTRCVLPSSHPSVVFRAAAYNEVGGYRKQFRVGQDLDLWLRLMQQGVHIAYPTICYESTFRPDSVSGARSRVQKRIRKHAREAALRRMRGEDERPALEQVEILTRPRSRTRGTDARMYYFIGACLSRQRDRSARDYFRQAVAANPLHLKSWIRLLAG